MATNLTPELLALLQQQDAATFNKNNLSPFLQGGQYYQPQYAGGGGGGEGGFDNPGSLAGYVGYDKSWDDGGNHQGEMFQVYNPDGSFNHDQAWNDDDYKKNLGLFLAAAGGLAFLPGGAVSTLTGGGAAGAGGSGAFLGEGMASGIPAWDAAATSAGLGLTAPAAATAAATAGGAGALTTAAKTLASTAPSWLGPAATVAGGLLGSQGQKTEQTSERKTDPRVDPYLFGDGTNPGLLGYTQQLLARQMAPGGLQGYDDMKSLGLLNMNIPVAGNGFSRFSNR
jgi:hypothetical protein